MQVYQFLIQVLHKDMFVAWLMLLTVIITFGNTGPVHVLLVTMLCNMPAWLLFVKINN